MSAYLVILIFLVISAFISFMLEKADRLLYFCCFAVLFCFMLFRYGQGTDWLAYNYIFSYAPDSFDFGDVFYTDAFHSEIGWKILCNLFTVFQFNFVQFVAIITVIEMLLLNRFISKWSNYRTLSILVAFPTLYLTYFFSALREGLVIAIFLGFMFDWLLERQYGRFVVAALLLSTVHMSALILIPLVFIDRISVRSLGSLLLLGIFVGIAGASGFLGTVLSFFGIAYSNGSFSPIAILYRVAMGSIVLFSWLSASEKSDLGLCETTMLKIYCVGLTLYFALMTNSLIASRLAMLFIAVEVALLPRLFSCNSRAILLLFLAVLLASIIMTLKNIDSYIVQAGYVSSVTVLNYPYISIFDPYQIFVYSQSRYLAYLDLSNNIGLRMLV